MNYVAETDCHTELYWFNWEKPNSIMAELTNTRVKQC